jgi:predicted dehydrogenase
VIRIGLVGCGHIGGVHSFALQHLIDLGLVDAAVVGTHDADRTRAEGQALVHGTDVYDDLDVLIAAVDLVWISTWTAAHLEAVEKAADAQKWIFCEKPLAPNLAAAEAVAAQLRRVPHQVGLVLRHAPVFAAVEERLDGRYGRVLATTLRDEQYFPIQGAYASDWRADPTRAGGGTLLEHSIHDVDLLRRLLGDPVDVSARTSTMFGHEGIDDAVALTFTYESGAHAQLASVWHQILSRGSTRRLEVFCEQAFLWTDDDGYGPLHVETDDDSEVIELDPPEWVGRMTVPEVFQKPLAPYATAALSFLSGLAATPPATGFPDAHVALSAHRLVDAAYRSAAAEGVPVATAR